MADGAIWEYCRSLTTSVRCGAMNLPQARALSHATLCLPLFGRFGKPLGRGWGRAVGYGWGCATRTPPQRSAIRSRASRKVEWDSRVELYIGRIVPLA